MVMCKVCGFKTSDQNKLQTHMEERHPEEDEEVEEASNRLEVDHGGICLKCQRHYKVLNEHRLRCHSGRSHKCPFCDVEHTELNTFANHIRTFHPFQAGLLPGRTAAAEDRHALSGEELLKLVRRYGLNTAGAVPYTFFAISFNDELACYRWVVYEVTKGMLEASEGVPHPPSKYLKCERVGGNQTISYVFGRLDCDHGHGAPKSLYRAFPEAFQESHLFTNLAAQHHGCNSGFMGSLQRLINKLAISNESVLVITGPTYSRVSTEGWLHDECGYNYRLPKGFFTFIIIRNEGREDMFQAFHCWNSGENEMLFVERKTIEDLQALIGQSWELYPLLRNLNYTWDSEEISKFCTVCQKSLPFQVYLEHLSTHKNVCRVFKCFRVFEDEEELKSHRRTVHYRRKCPQCEYTASTEATVRRHMVAVHSGKKEIKCSQCPSMFSTPSALQTHMTRVHTEVKKYYCPIGNCGKGYGAKCNFEDHLLAAHAGRNLFFCPDRRCLVDVPPRRYSTLQNLRKHRKNEHGLLTKDDEEVKSQTMKGYLPIVLQRHNLSLAELYTRSEQMRQRKKKEERPPHTSQEGME